MLAGASALHCARQPAIADPEPAVLRFAAAAKRGDADAIHGLLTEESRRSHGRSGVRRLIQDSRVELRQLGEALERRAKTADVVARVRFDYGGVAVVELSHGVARITSAGLLPANPRTPPEALDQLRQAILRRSYPGLMRVLSTETRAMIDNDLASLARALEHPEMLEIVVSGDEAEVEVPGGHWVKMKREGGVWRVDDLH